MWVWHNNRLQALPLPMPQFWPFQPVPDITRFSMPISRRSSIKTKHQHLSYDSTLSQHQPLTQLNYITIIAHTGTSTSQLNSTRITLPLYNSLVHSIEAVSSSIPLPDTSLTRTRSGSLLHVHIIHSHSHSQHNILSHHPTQSQRVPPTSPPTAHSSSSALPCLATNSSIPRGSRLNGRFPDHWCRCKCHSSVFEEF